MSEHCPIETSQERELYVTLSSGVSDTHCSGFFMESKFYQLKVRNILELSSLGSDK